MNPRTVQTQSCSDSHWKYQAKVLKIFGKTYYRNSKLQAYFPLYLLSPKSKQAYFLSCYDDFDNLVPKALNLFLVLSIARCPLLLVVQLLKHCIPVVWL